MSVKMRQMVEREIATAFIEAALAAGYTIGVDCGETAAGIYGNYDYKGIDKALILAAMFSTDEDRLDLFMDDAKHPEYGTRRLGWCLFIYGNDGWDVISDYTTNLEHLMFEPNKISDKYSG